MKEMDHEISVDVEVEERPSTSVNIYGLPVAPCGRRNEQSVGATSEAVPLKNMNRVVSSVLRKSFFFSIIIYNSKYFVPHRPVTVRIRAAAKTPLKPLAAPLKMLQ